MMSRIVRTPDATPSRGASFRCPALLVAALGGLLAVPSFPAHADVFDHTLLVSGRSGTVEVLKVTVRVDWTLPAVDPDEGGRSWQLRVSTRALTCSGGDSTGLVVPITFISTRLGHHDLDLSGPDFHVGSSYFVRACLPLASGRHHDTNQVEISVVVPIAVGGIIARLPGSPQITGVLGPRPIRPGFWIGVTGRSFGDRPGRLFLRIGGMEYSVRVSASDWHSGAIVGQLDRSISGVPDGPALLIVERADSERSFGSSVSFVATREVRLVPGGEVHVDSCSDEGGSNWCNSVAYSGAPSLAAYHGSIHTFGESGTDQFSIALANGWRFHDLEFSHGEAGMPEPTWALRGGGPTSPHIQFNWRNPSGWGVSHHYGYRLFVVGPVGVPHR
jgi:hypothetical protein